jgi:hypothetical protein
MRRSKLVSWVVLAGLFLFIDSAKPSRNGPAGPLWRRWRVRGFLTQRAWGPPWAEARWMGTPACPNYADRVIPSEVTEAAVFSAFLPTT